MKLTAYRYELPLKSPFRTAERSWAFREGILLRLEHDGITAWGEAAPLPGFSRESLEDARKQLRQLSSGLYELFRHEGPDDASAGHPGLPDKPFPSPKNRAGGDEGGAGEQERRQEGISDYPRVTRFHERHRVLPSLQFAIDTLWADYHSRKEQISPGSLLFGRMPAAIPVNAVLPIQDSTEAGLQKAAELLERGYRTLKVKLGRDPAADISFLRELRDRYPDLTIRADANRGWDLKQALLAFRELEEVGLEYCEEPLEQCTAEHLEVLTARTNVPVALDETLSEPGFGPDLLEFINFFILKPMVLGGLANLFATKGLADDHDIDIIVTSSLEGSTGRSMTALIAGGIGTVAHAHGLATGSILARDFTASPSTEDQPRIHTPVGPGLPPADPNLVSKISTEHIEL